MKYTTLCSLFFLLFFINILSSQTIETWQNHVPATFVYALSNDEAEDLFLDPADGNIEKIIGQILKRSPYTIFTTNVWLEAPDTGHFIYFNIIEKDVVYRYESFIPYEVTIIPQYGAFTIQIRDEKGIVRSDAMATLFYDSYYTDQGKAVKESREIFYDPAAKTYSIKIRPEEKKNAKLIIELDGMRSFFLVDNNRIEEERQRERESEQKNPKIRFYSYLITDKYSYRSEDTVRLKSYILADNRKPLKKELSLQIGRYRDMKTIETISPYRPGSYMGEFVLEPSLGLRLDENYTLRLVDEKGVIVAATNFKYEDYQLLDYKLEVEPSLKNHFHTDTNYIRIKATDVNNLPLPDSKVHITLLRSYVAKAYEDGYTLPETIYHEEFFMPESEPLLIPVSGDLFGKANLWYIVQVQITTPDNRTLTYRDQIRYDYMYQDIVCTPRDGKLVFEYVQKGKSVPVKATLKYNANQQARTIPVELPYMEALSPDVTSYELKVDLMGEPVVIFPEDVIDIRIEGGLADKYLDISLHNPMAIEATWYIYEGKN